MSAPNSNADGIPLAIEPRMAWLVNNQRFADVTFVVGEGKQIVYGHKAIIATGSPVFERMFFANHELRMSGSEPIAIPDLTAAGFINMLSYIYTNQLNDFDLSQLFETFVAGDKYQVYNMNATMCSIIKDKLNASNCCIIYDQLMHLPSEQVGVSLDQVKAMIRYNSGLAFNGEHFVNISEETLVDLLKMDALTIDEMDVLRSCAKWVDEEIKRQNLEAIPANKQEIFKAIKNYIGFSRITFDQLKNFNPVKDLLTSDELCSLLLHHLDVSTITIECYTTRKKLTLQSACCIKYQSTNDAQTHNFNYNMHGIGGNMNVYSHWAPPPLQQHFSEFALVFSTSGVIFIATIYTFIPTHIQDLDLDLELSIYDNASGLKLGLNYEKLLTGDNSWNFRFIDHVKIDASKYYKIVFKFPSTELSYHSLSRDTIMKNAGFSPLKLTLSTTGGNSGYHCLKKIDFYDLFS